MTESFPFFKKIIFLEEVLNVFKKFLFVFFLFVFIFICNCSVFASGSVPGLAYNIPESPEYPNHNYIFIYRLETGGTSGSGVYMIKYYEPIIVNDISNGAGYKLRISFESGLVYKYNPSSDTFELEYPRPYNGSIYANYKDYDGNWVHWNDPNVVLGMFPLAANHDIYINDDVLFFWTIQKNLDSPHLYRLPVTEMMKTLLAVGGRTLGVALVIFGIVLAISWVRNLVSWFLP